MPVKCLLICFKNLTPVATNHTTLSAGIATPELNILEGIMGQFKILSKTFSCCERRSSNYSYGESHAAVFAFKR